MNRDTPGLRVVLGGLALALALIVAILPDTMIDHSLAVIGALLIALSALVFIAGVKIAPAVFALGLVPMWIGIIQKVLGIDSFSGGHASCDGCLEVGYIAGSVVILLYGTGLVLAALGCGGLLAGMLATNAKSAKLNRNYESSADA